VWEHHAHSMVEYDYFQCKADRYFKFAENNDEPDEAEFSLNCNSSKC
jgi:hypothetical protein